MVWKSGLSGPRSMAKAGALARERSNGKISKTKCNKMLRGATIKSVRGFFGNVIKGMKPGF
jgi:hypothetical protein